MKYIIEAILFIIFYMKIMRYYNIIDTTGPYFLLGIFIGYVVPMIPIYLTFHHYYDPVVKFDNLNIVKVFNGIVMMYIVILLLTMLYTDESSFISGIRTVISIILIILSYIWWKVLKQFYL
jgi:hypothetical protein